MFMIAEGHFNFFELFLKIKISSINNRSGKNR